MGDDDDKLDLAEQVKSIPPEHAERLRARRPGYDRVNELVQTYLKQPPDKQAQISEVDLSKSYVVPMFRALGWSVEEYLATTDASQHVDLELGYRDIQVPVEVKKMRDPVSIQPVVFREWRGGRTWAILTDFERVQIWDLEDESLIVETSPLSYVASDKEEHDLVAASVFYDRLALPRLAQSSDSTSADLDSGALDETAKSVARSDDSRELENLIAALSDSNESIRQRAVGALGRIGDSRAVEPLLSMLSDSNESIRQAAVEALGSIRDPRAVDPLIAVLSDPNESIRRAAIEALGWIGDPRASWPLLVFLSDLNDSIRLAALGALSEMDLPEAAGPLIQALQDEGAGVQQDVIAALERLLPSSESVPPQPPEQISIAVRALSDAPSEVDLLGFSVYAEALADFIRNEKTEKPLTIGIDAAWGMGKTTLMQMVRKRLEHRAGGGSKERSFTTVWFNAWKYDQEESLWAALALEILAQIRERCNLWQRGKLWWKLNCQRLDWSLLLRGLLKSLAYVAAIFLLGAAVYGIVAIWLGVDVFWQYVGTAGILSIIVALYTTGKEAYDHIAGPFDLKLSKYVRKPDYKERVGFLSEFEDDFKKVIDVVTQGGKWPLVVFIDDLDRCAPPKPAEIIEAINILLDARHCVFVIGMDAQAVAASIETKYKDLCQYLDDRDDPGGLTLGQRFLEKIIQISFHIPTSDPIMIASFVDTNLGVLPGPAPDEPPRLEVKEAELLIKAEQRAGMALDGAARAVEAARPDLRGEAITEARRDIVAQTFDDSDEVRDAIRMAAPYLGYNPRKIKRFINVFRLQAFIANRRGLLESGVVKLNSLAKWVCIELRWPSMIEVMRTDQCSIINFSEAHAMQQEVRRLQSEGGPDVVKCKNLQDQIEGLLPDPRSRRLVAASDLVDLLDGMDHNDRSVFPYYLHLAQVTIEQISPDDVPER